MTRYRMLAKDVDSIPTQYRVWVANEPDLTGASYTGPKSGSNALVDISVYAIQDSSAIVDFNLPLPSLWNPYPSELIKDFPIRKVLPYPVADSQLAIIDGYAYLFGGKITDKIFRATVNNPADWIDTGTTLPTPLFGAQLAIADGYIYLFGGNNGSGSVSTIFSASISDPLTWTNHGSLLPHSLQYSNVAMAGGTLYLFGGQTSNQATNTVLTASTSTPLAWSVATFTTPTPAYGSVLAQADGYWMLYGGLTASHSPTSAIWSATVSHPNLWSLDGYLPYATAFGQFFPMGSDGYLIGPMVTAAATGFTPILQCKLSSPNQFIDTKQVVRGSISHAQQAIIYDRYWLFGGSGETAIFACNQTLKYLTTFPTAETYGQITRVLLPMTDNLDNPYQALGLPYWRTSYQF